MTRFFSFSKLLVINPYFNFLLNLLSNKNYFCLPKKLPSGTWSSLTLVMTLSEGEDLDKNDVFTS